MTPHGYAFIVGITRCILSLMNNFRGASWYKGLCILSSNVKVILSCTLQSVAATTPNSRLSVYAYGQWSGVPRYPSQGLGQQSYPFGSNHFRCHQPSLVSVISAWQKYLQVYGLILMSNLIYMQRVMGSVACMCMASAL